MADGAVAISGGRVVPIVGEEIPGGTVLIENGKIAAVGGNVPVPDGAGVIDAAGSWVLPGFIEAHGHLGVSEEAEGWAGQDTNEMTEPVTAHVRAIDAINPAEMGFRDAISGGVLAVNVNPGSGNPVGGNPKRVYAEQKKTPSTRLGTA